MKNNVKDITGKKYNYLTALKRLTPSIKNGRMITYWLFECICGNQVMKESCDVKRGNIKSCGCKTKQLQRDARSKPEGVAAANNLFNSYKYKCANDRGYEFQLDLKTFLHLTKENCYYCGIEPKQVIKSRNSQYIYNGIDRVNNDKGYIINNVVACCKDCNSKKAGITKDMVVTLYKWFQSNEEF